MTKKKQREIDRRAKRLGQILQSSEWWTGQEMPELLYERAFLTCWLRRQFLDHEVFQNEWAWK